MDGGSKSSEVHTAKKLFFCERTIDRNVDVNGNSGESQKKERWEEILHLLREYINNYEQNVGRNMNTKGYFGEISI